MSRRVGGTMGAAALASVFVIQSAGGCSSSEGLTNLEPEMGTTGAGGGAGAVAGSSQAGNGAGASDSTTSWAGAGGGAGSVESSGPGAGGGAAGSGVAGGRVNPAADAGTRPGTGGAAGAPQGTIGRGGRSGGGGNLAGADAGSGAAGGASGAGGRAGGLVSGGAGGASPGRPDGGTGGSTGGAEGDIIAHFQNGVFWNDVDGKRIEAHGGGFLRDGDTWYWVGEDKSANSGTFKAVNCYSSKDLEHWKFENAIITKSTTSLLAASGRIIERPKITYNDSTKKYVMWLHWDGNSYGDAEAGVFSSDTVCGNYKYERNFRPNKNMSRDCTLFKDDNGKAYFMSSANENADMMMYELSSDYLNIERQVAKLWAGAKREAPAVFKHDGTYYFITSACTGWDPNQAQYATATSIEGPWSALKNIGNNTTFDTQSTYVIPVIGSKTTTYIYAGDRWQDPDLASSKYVWLPLKVNGSSLSLDNYTRWQLNVTTGEWSTNLNDDFLSQAGWRLMRADSEETQKENGSAKNAFDNSESTIWHTAYTGTTPKHPHEIQIDLGGTYAIQGMRCLPRQDKDANGMIARYEFYASEDASNWGSPVASGTWDSSRAEKVVSFPRRNAHYIRLVALSEISGGAWTSLAEIDLVPAK